MNPIAILLGIVVIILIYILYLYMNPVASTLNSSASLLSSVPPITSLNNPGSLRCAYGVWVYVNSWDANATKTIFSRDKNVRLYLDKSSPTLYLEVTNGDSTKQTVKITDSFALQKWVYVIISMDNQFVDTYIDGKLILSKKLDKLPSQPSSDATANPVILGGTPWDASVAKFIRWTTPVDPQTAWSYYLSGNGSSMTKSWSSYGANLSILKDNVLSSKITLF